MLKIWYLWIVVQCENILWRISSPTEKTDQTVSAKSGILLSAARPFSSRVSLDSLCLYIRKKWISLPEKVWGCGRGIPAHVYVTCPREGAKVYPRNQWIR